MPSVDALGIDLWRGVEGARPPATLRHNVSPVKERARSGGKTRVQDPTVESTVIPSGSMLFVTPSNPVKKVPWTGSTYAIKTSFLRHTTYAAGGLSGRSLSVLKKVGMTRGGQEARTGDRTNGHG